MIAISSRENKTLKLLRSLQRKKGRKETGLYFVEGVRMVEEALRWRGSDIEAVIVSESFEEKNRNFVYSLDESGKTVYTAKESLFAEVCNTETPQGIGAILKIPSEVELAEQNANFILILDGVSEPGNLGTIIRTAEAAGVDVVILTKGCADLYNPKVVRATMGSLFRVPCVIDADSTAITMLKNDGFTVIATALNDSVEISSARISGKRALVIGSEAFGVSEEVLSLSDIKVRIPMAGEVESLNAGVAAGISMYLLKP